MSRERSRSRSAERDHADHKDEKPSDDAKLFIGNLSFETRKEDLSDAFAEHGEIADAFIVNDRNTGRPKGFGFVIYRNAADADRAFERMQGFELHGRTIRVDRPNAKSNNGPRDGGRGGRDDRRGGYDDRRGGYDDRRGGRDDRRGGYDDRRGGFDDRRGGRDDRRGGFDGPRGGDRGGDRPRGACYAFQKGECRYGNDCRFSHDA